MTTRAVGRIGPHPGPSGRADDAEQAAAFAALPFAHDAVAVRRWDDEAKDPSVTPPEFGHFEALLTALLEPGPLSS
jgi:predicted HD phosphohydrolase